MWDKVVKSLYFCRYFEISKEMRTLIFIISFALAGAVFAQKKPAGFEVAGRAFKVPSEWKAEQPASRMRKAQYKVGEAELVVFYFGKGQGGTVEANVARWLGQFKEPGEKLHAKTKEQKIAGAKITTVTAAGTYMSGPPFGAKVAKAGYAMRAAIIECEGGPVFIKMTGPRDAVAQASDAFDKLARSGFE
jgi:hypothetical protein